MICVYEANCSDFSGNGLGVLTPSDCSVTETLNGEWELTLTHPLDKLGKWQRLTEGRILTAPVPATSTPRVNLITQSAGTDIYKVSTQSGTLRLRSGPGTSYKILKSYKKNTEVILIQKTSSSWYEVTCPDGKRGYMSTEYLTYVRTEGNVPAATGEVIEPRQLRDQPFRIYRVVPELTKVTVYARHIFYDLLDNMLQKVEPSSGTVGAAVVRAIADGCLSSHDFIVPALATSRFSKTFSIVRCCIPSCLAISALLSKRCSNKYLSTYAVRRRSIVQPPFVPLDD